VVVDNTASTTSAAVKPGAVARTVILPDPAEERTTATALPWYNFAWLAVAGLPSVRSALPAAMSRPAPVTSKVTVWAAFGARLPSRSRTCTSMVDTCRPSFLRVIIYLTHKPKSGIISS
jgi:hypothetical protein